MCSILGLFDLQPGDDLPRLRRHALELSQRQRHRGPDWSGVHADDGAILVHDDAADVLEPWVHFAPYVTGDADSIVEAVERVKALTELERRNLRESALHFVQEHHSYTARVQQVLGALGLEA